jgi:hypothetical protein
MKRYLVLAALVCPAAAYAQQTYTNADLARFEVPGAYTNDDLRRLPPAAPHTGPVAAPLAPAPAQAPADEFQAAWDALARTRGFLAAELEYERGRIAYSESAFAGAADRLEPRAGYRARAKGLVLELEKRIALLDAQMEATLDAARRAGAIIDRGAGAW